MATRASLAHGFASLFAHPTARARLANLAGAGRTTLPTFNLSTTSLRHLPEWFDRLRDIDRGMSARHGNYFSDPAAIGLVDNSVRPRVLTPAGQAFLAHRASLRNQPARAEYELVKILYWSRFSHSPQVQCVLDKKRSYMESLLAQLGPSPSRQLLLESPSLLVIAELISSFPGAVHRLVSLPGSDLRTLAEAGPSGFTNLCSGGGYPRGLSRLCRRIGEDYRRAQDRRLHYIVSMALLSILNSLPTNRALNLNVPAQFSMLLKEADLHTLHRDYTSDVAIWSDGDSFRICKAGAMRLTAQQAAPTPGRVSLRPLAGCPLASGSASATDPSRTPRRYTKSPGSTIVIDQRAAELAEDLVEASLLRPRYGAQLVRVGHRAGEIKALPDGLVPGADFYVVDTSGTPVHFIEVKAISRQPPVDVFLTRAEYLRALRCGSTNLPYRLILARLGPVKFYEVNDLTSQIARLELAGAVRFCIRIG